MEIRRDQYLNRLIRKRHNGLIKVITGVRRCGKSYLMNTIFYQWLVRNGVPRDHIIRFAFDSAEDLILMGENLLDMEKKKRPADPEKFIAWMRRQLSDDGMYYLLLDEVQILGSFEAVLNGYLRKENTDLYVTGSNARFLSRDISTEFAGRGDEISLYPLSFSEFMTVYPGDRYEGLAQYMLYGGIPLVVLQEHPQDKARLLTSLFQEIYIRDIQRRHSVRNTRELGELLDVLSSGIGSLTNPEKLKNTFHTLNHAKITAATIQRYIEYFEESFLLESARRYDVKGNAYIGTPLKYYYTDLGLRNARIGFRQFERSHAVENVIYNELRSRGYNVDIGVVPISERNKDGKSVRKMLEIDFICYLDGQKTYIQSAWSIPDEEKRLQETRPLRRVDDSFKKMIVTGDIVPARYDEKGIQVMNIYDFLMNPDSLQG